MNRAVPNPTSTIKSLPHWRVLLRPMRYEEELIPSLGECWSLVTRTKLSLRGWDYPHIDFPENQELGSNWIASWSDFQGHKEYWRLYQSGQFVHLFTVREVTEWGWQDKLRNGARVAIGPQSREGDLRFLSVGNFLWSITEVFEFAARLAEVGTYRDVVRVRIGLYDIAGFALTETERLMHNLYVNESETLEKTWEVTSKDLLAKSSEHALKATAWFFDRFGWHRLPTDALREEQEQLLKGTF
jgi:hypothetical protein